MTVSREDLYNLVEKVRPEKLEQAAKALSSFASDADERTVTMPDGRQRVLPRSLGMVAGEPRDSEDVEHFLAEGFGRR